MRCISREVDHIKQLYRDVGMRHLTEGVNRILQQLQCEKALGHLTRMADGSTHHALSKISDARFTKDILPA